MTYLATTMFVRTSTMLRRFSNDETGASMVEYALLVALIAIVSIVAVSIFGNALRDELSDIGTSVANT